MSSCSNLFWRLCRSRRVCFVLAPVAVAMLGAGSASAASCTTGTDTETCTFSGAGIGPFGPTLGSSTNVTETSTVTVPSSTITGPITNVTVTITGLNATAGFSSNGLNNFSFLLAPPNVSSSNKAFDFLNSTCNTASNATLLMEDSVSGVPSQAPNGDTGCSLSGSNTYSPYNAAGVTDVWPSPINSNFVQAPPEFTGSFAIFNYTSTSEPVGTWTLYISDENPDCDEGSCDSVSISGWTLSITFTPPSSADFTTTSLASSSNTAFICPSRFSGSCSAQVVTLTATVTDTTNSNTNVSGGTVSFLDGGSPITCAGGNQTVSNGSATCDISFLPPEGPETLTASYSGVSGGFEASNSDGSPLTVTAIDHTQQSGNQYCNNGTVSSQSIVTSPSPSYIFIGSPDNTTAPSGGGLVDSISVELQSLSTGSLEGEEQQNFLLVGPNGEALVFDANGGTLTDSQTLSAITFADSGTALAYDTAFSSNATYQPLSYFNQEGESVTGQSAFPSGTPTITNSNEAAPTGSATFETFVGKSATGTWQLYYGNTGNGTSTVGGWCINVTGSGGTGTTTTVSSDTPTASTSQSFNLTATVTPATTGTVTFVAASSTGVSTTLGQANVGSNSKATLSVPANTFTGEGTFEITAEFTDSTNTFGPSSGSVAQRINNPGPTPTINGSVYTYCSATPIVVPYEDGLSAPSNAAPYPSNIVVSNLPGTLNAVAVQMTLAGADGNGSFENLDNVASLLVGPNNANIDFFSNVGGSGGSSGAFTISDSGTVSDPYSASGGAPEPSAGIYLPQSYGVGGTTTKDTFPACPSLVSNCTSGTLVGPPAPTSGYNYATNVGSSTFSSVFPAGTDANGTWSLYLYADASNNPLGTVSSWCVALTENLPELSISKSHTGSFTLGGSGTYTIQVSNAGPGPTGGTLTLTDTLPSGLTAASMSETANSGGGTGSDWSCSGSSCTRTTAMPAGESDTITLTVNVGATTPVGTNSITNQVQVSGGGASNSPTASDPTTIVTAPSLSVSKNHTGSTFTQGQTATWNITVSNAANSGATSGTTTVTDSLPNGTNNGVAYAYTLSSYSGSGWSCTGTGTSSVSCTSSQVVNGGTSFNTLQLTVNVPAASPTSVSNTASASGGGSSGTVSSNTDTATVAQAVAKVLASSGSGQSANLNTAFTNPLVVTVEDGASLPISGASVTFNAPTSGASGTFSNGTTTITSSSNSSGQLSETFTANGTGGAYTVTATSGGITTNPGFSLTNNSAAATITNVTSTAANGSYGVGAVIPVLISFSSTVSVTGTPLLALNSGGTASYTSGSGTSTLTFTYTVAAGQNSSALDATSTNALTLNGGTITTGGTPAILTLPAPGAAGSLSANKSIVINTTAPTVVSYSVDFGAENYNLLGASRIAHLPWTITGITVVFSQPITTANTSSLGGISATGLSGVGTSTLTWTFAGITNATLATTLAGSGANAIKDSAGNALAGGSGFSQSFSVLYGDFNGDGVVNSLDFTQVVAAESAPYNIFADINGDGVVNSTDAAIVRTQEGHSQQ